MKKIFYFAITALSLSSCSGFLNEVPKGELTTANFCTTEPQAVEATNAIYSYLTVGYAVNGLFDQNYGGVFYNYYWMMQDLFADNSVTQLTSSDYTSLSNMQVDAYNIPLQVQWRHFYQEIKTCNVVLDDVPSVKMDTIEQKSLLAEARFVRAMMYFDLVRMWGDVPLHTTSIQGVDEANVPRTSKDVIYKLIISDLKIAQKDLNYTPRLVGGVPDKDAATALLARVYLTYGAQYKDKASFQNAVTCAKAVIPDHPMLANYGDLFKLANRFNSEIIWGVNFSASKSGDFAGAQFLVRLLPPALTNMGIINNGQGWETATDNLYGAYTSGDTRRDVTLSKVYISGDTTVALPYPYFFKYWDRVIESKGNNTDQIFPAIRTPEMYLIIAEADNEINNGPTQEALEALETVRNRAGVGAQAIPTDYQGFKDAVLNERRLEFAMEGQRWFDLTRMCSVSEFQTLIKRAKPTATPQAYNFLFPIPQEEITLSNGILTQNPGY